MFFPGSHIIHKLWRLPRHDALLLIEVTFWLAVAAVAIAVFPFRHVGRLATRAVRQPELCQAIRREEVRRIRWAIDICGRRVPWPAVCFQKGLAAQVILRRRGVPSILYYGAAIGSASHLRAHVWVRDGDVDVIGGEMAHRFAILTTFPSRQPDSSAETS
jgi:hypothetical protein